MSTDPSTQKSTLNNVLYPALGRVLKSHQSEEDVVRALAKLKAAFDQAETVQPGISRKFVQYLIETLRSQQKH